MLKQQKQDANKSVEEFEAANEKSKESSLEELQTWVDAEQKLRAEEVMEELTLNTTEMCKQEEQGRQRDEEYALVIAENNGNIAELEKVKDMLSFKDNMISELEKQLRDQNVRFLETMHQVDLGVQDFIKEIVEPQQIQARFIQDLIQTKAELKSSNEEIDKLKSEIEKCESDYAQQKEEIEELKKVQDELLDENESIATSNTRLITASKNMLTINGKVQQLLKICMQCSSPPCLLQENNPNT